MIDPKHLRHV